MSHMHHMRVGPVRFRVASHWAGPIAELRRLYADYPALSGEAATATARIEAARPWRRWVRPAVHIGGDYTIPDALPLPLSQGLLAAEMAMNLQVALGWRQHLLLHASSVERGGRAIIMVGASGSGKSTLAAQLGEGLGEGDWRLLGDEFAMLGLDDGQLSPFPRLISLKNEAIAAMERLVPAARLGPAITGTPKGTIRHLVPRADAIARMDERATPALLLFPTFGGEPGLRPVAPSEAFMRLTDSSTNYVALGEAGFAALTKLVRDVPAVAIGYASGEQGMAAVEALWADLRP
ncbi:MAG: HprK-related kinase A [Sphingopyxis sp.]